MSSNGEADSDHITNVEPYLQNGGGLDASEVSTPSPPTQQAIHQFQQDEKTTATSEQDNDDKYMQNKINNNVSLS